jgi:hypothetical protein
MCGERGMKVYRHDDDMAHPSRARNWVVARSDPSNLYYDFTKSPELIPDVLEDFRPFAPWPAIQEFYTMLTEINGERSQFETNDSAFNGPAASDGARMSGKRLQVSGRVMVLFRDLVLNTRRQNVEWLERGIHSYASGLTPAFEDGLLGTSIMRMHLAELASESQPAAGYELAVHFWAWGDSDDEVFANLAVVVQNMRESFSRVGDDAIRELS